MSTKDESLQETGRCAAASIVEMVAALECNYERLEELRTIPRGTIVFVHPHASEGANGLTYGLLDGMTLAEDCNGIGWDVVDVTDSAGATVSVYSFSVRIADDHDRQERADLIAAAGECTSREEAEQRIQEDALSVEMRGAWYPYDTEPKDAAKPVEFKILLTTGGPAVRIMGELDNGEPSRAWLEVQDWGTPWTQYFDIEQDTLLAYARCFYFGEG